MLQRNDTGSPWTFMDEPIRQVLPGETTDHPVLLDGWTAVEDDKPEPKTKSRRPAAADTEGGEPQ